MNPPHARDPDDPAPFPPFEVDSSEHVYESPWCSLRRDMLRGTDGRLQEYHVFEVGRAVAVVPVLPDGSIVMLWQFRHPLRTSHWEIPAGRMEETETPREAALRELLEETGYRAASLTHVAGFYPTNGISPQHADIFVAEGCVEVRPPTPDPTERIEVRALPEEWVRRQLLAGRFADGFTALALFYHFSRTAPDGSGQRSGERP